MAGSPPKARACARLALPPRLARMIVDSHRLGAGEAAAEIAAVSPSAGSAATGVDLDARLDSFRRDRSPRAASARSLAQRWASQVAATEGPVGEDTSPSTGIMLAFAFPDRVARNRGNGGFVLANGRGARWTRLPRWRAAPYIAVAELTGTAANGRILAGGARSRRPRSSSISPIRSRPPTRFRSTGACLRCGRGARRPCTRSRCRKRRWPLKPSAETARVLADGLIAAGLDKFHGRKLFKQWRDRVMFLRKAEGESWLTFPTTHSRRSASHGWCRRCTDKTSLKELSAGELSDALMTLLPWELRARLEREAPTHFERRPAPSLRSTNEAEQGPTIAVRLQELFGLNTHPSIAKGAVPLVLELLSPRIVRCR